MEVTLTGTVVNGNRIGKSIGFPTANIPIDPALNLPDGVYAAWAWVNDQRYIALVNVGYKPTIQKPGERLLEAHLLGFQGNLYGTEITVTLTSFIRPEETFASLEELKQAIENDKIEIVKRLSSC